MTSECVSADTNDILQIGRGGAISGDLAIRGVERTTSDLEGNSVNVNFNQIAWLPAIDMLHGKYNPQKPAPNQGRPEMVSGYAVRNPLTLRFP